MPNPEPEEDIEMLIADKLGQKGLLDIKLFSQFDPDQTGKIHPEQFKIAIQPSGIKLKSHEIISLVNKFGGTTRNGQIAYQDFLQYVKIKQMFSSTKRSQKVGANQIDIGKPKTKTLQEKVSEGIRKVSLHMDAKSMTLNKLFGMLDTGGGLLSISSLSDELMELGFPKDLATASDITLVARGFSKKTTGMMSYQEFNNFFSGITPSIEVQERIKNFNLRDLKRVLIKLNNQSNHKVFREMDTDRDGIITTTELAQGLITFGLSKTTANNPEFREYAETFTRQRKGFFRLPEFKRFVTCRGGNPHKKVQNINVNWSTAEILSLLNKTQEVNFSELFRDYDPEHTHTIRQPEFRQCIYSIGYNLSESQVNDIFLQYGNNGVLDYDNFMRLVRNAQHTKGLKMVEPNTKRSQQNDTRSQKKTFHLKDQNGERVQRKGKGRGDNMLNHFSESPGQNQSPIRTQSRKHFSPEDQINMNGRTKIPGKKRISGRSINFATQQPGGNSSLNILSKPQDIQSTQVSRRRQYTSPGEQSYINVDHPAPSRKKCIPARTTYDKDPPIGSRRGGVGRLTDGNLNTNFNPKSDTPTRGTRRVVTEPGGKSTLSLAFSPKEPSPEPTKKKCDANIIEKINHVICANGRARHIFKEWNVSYNPKGLLKKEFQKGLRQAGVSLDENQINDLYDDHNKDHDGILTYSDFVRMLASGSKN